MATLHTVNKSPFERNALESCLRLAKAGSSVLLFEDGVIGAMRDTRFSEKITQAMGDFSFYVLGPDIKARGLNDDKIIDGIQVVDYNGFVDLTAEHDTVQSWL
ncbi:MAG: sulfurtransferase complex subunit TusB [Proteobacteria bacterium]|nr:sulfurtransferase complex subunit TusB [Pseudomonadota bacterium]